MIGSDFAFSASRFRFAIEFSVRFICASTKFPSWIWNGVELKSK